MQTYFQNSWTYKVSKRKNYFQKLFEYKFTRALPIQTLPPRLSKQDFKIFSKLPWIISNPFPNSLELFLKALQNSLKLLQESSKTPLSCFKTFQIIFKLNFKISQNIPSPISKTLSKITISIQNTLMFHSKQSTSYLKTLKFSFFKDLNVSLKPFQWPFMCQFLIGL